MMFKYLIVTIPFQIFDNDDKNVKREVWWLEVGEAFWEMGKISWIREKGLRYSIKRPTHCKSSLRGDPSNGEMVRFYKQKHVTMRSFLTFQTGPVRLSEVLGSFFIFMQVQTKMETISASLFSVWARYKFLKFLSRTTHPWVRGVKWVEGRFVEIKALLELDFQLRYQRKRAKK